MDLFRGFEKDMAISNYSVDVKKIFQFLIFLSI